MRRFALAALLSAVAACSQSSGNPNGERPVAILDDPFREVLAGQTVSFSATDSFDPDDPTPAFPHGIASFEWTITTAPEGSTAQMVASSDGTATLRTDAWGDFAGELVVVDADGRSSEPFPLGVVAEPFGLGAIYVELSWEAADRDLDLHLVRSPGSFGDPVNDCSGTTSLTQEWGASGIVGDPTLADDVSEGPGPEQITLFAAQQTSYDVFVHHFNAQVVGDSLPTIRIGNKSVMIADRAVPVPLPLNEVWHVGTLAFATSDGTPAFTPADTIAQP